VHVDVKRLEMAHYAARGSRRYPPPNSWPGTRVAIWSVVASEMRKGVLQPGWYTLIRNGHKIGSRRPKTAQTSAISGRIRTG
jgi:hypothetical protein